jgi:hypothetical protein
LYHLNSVLPISTPPCVTLRISSCVTRARRVTPNFKKNLVPLRMFLYFPFLSPSPFLNFSIRLRYTPHTANEEALLALLKCSHDNQNPTDLYEGMLILLLFLFLSMLIFAPLDICLAYSRLNLYSPIVDVRTLLSLSCALFSILLLPLSHSL